MVSETAAVSDGRSFAAQIAARVLPQSFCNVPQPCFLCDMAHE